ncbi:LysR substrate-binding domain-containing protein [Pseudarthrobacter raffinosi]|uniref:LysR substrate-binding domain-containing protein n=1 Tax=Pseudarthrobacter raffinosi TaxID=2953651 RepID=UPI00208DE397|nr:LysR substrate-binding domain-containing protein [Pseudarthrobacter sp. MDT3-9]MCO4251226.1 LysR substrate-binding domain-containing protein [Pseudarthrobacter sp. MDT3-9]
MELRHLRYFVAVAEERHFGRAAARLHIVQPTLSMQIQSLERELGGPLFVRTSRRVDLTEAGEVLLVEARRTLAQAERSVTVVHQSLSGQTGTVRVGFSGVAMLSGNLIGTLRRHHNIYPDVEVTVQELAPLRQTELIGEGSLDVGFGPRGKFDPDIHCRTEKIARIRLIAAIPVEHPLADRPAIRYSDLDQERVIVYSHDDGEDLSLEHLRSQGQEPIVAHRAPTTLGVLALVAAGLGIAVVPDATEQIRIPEITFRPLVDPEVSVDLLLLSRSPETSGAVNAFLAIARAGIPL